MPGLNSILNSIFGSSNERKLKKYKDQVHAINDLEEKYEKFSDEELKDKTFEFKKLLASKNLKILGFKLFTSESKFILK